MAYYLIGRKKDNTFVSFVINDGKLPELDFHTSRFKNKEDLANSLSEYGISPEDDLFIAGLDSKKQVSIKEIIYNNEYTAILRYNARRELEKERITTNKTYQEAIDNYKSNRGWYKSLLEKDYFNMYTSFRIGISDNSLDSWIKKDYTTFRDVVESLVTTKKLNIKNQDDFFIALNMKQKLLDDRAKIEDQIQNRLLGQVPDQETFMFNQNNIIGINSYSNYHYQLYDYEIDTIRKTFNGTKIEKKAPVGKIKKEVTNTSEKEKIKLQHIGKISVKYLSSKEQEKKKLELFSFFTDLNYWSSNYITSKGNKYKLDFSALPFELDTKDQQDLESNISSKMLENIYLYTKDKEDLELEDPTEQSELGTQVIYRASNIMGLLNSYFLPNRDPNFNRAYLFYEQFKYCQDKAKGKDSKWTK